jgi:hypothetical protein
MDDCLEIVNVLRSNGLEPTLVDIGMGRADFRLGVKFKDPYDIYYAGRCLNKYTLGVVVDKDFFYFSNVEVDEKTFSEIVGG